MKNHNINLRTIFAAFLASFLVAQPFFLAKSVNAVSSTTPNTETTSFTMSPMNQKALISPGDSYSSSFRLSNPGSNTKDVTYELKVTPFYVDESYNSVFDSPEAYNEITEWITIDSPLTNTISPNETAEVFFTINVPDNAPAGGQYAAIIATIKAAEGEGGLSIQENQAIAHIIFTEITGRTVKQGEIIDAKVPSFLLSGNITGSSTIKNTGNVHGTATYKLQVFPLFSSEEVFTNESNPETRTIVPDRTFYNEIAWPNTPAMGLFNVVYTVDFEGLTTEVSKLVIICPLWMLFIILFVVLALIIGIIIIVKKHSSRRLQ